MTSTGFPSSTTCHCRHIRIHVCECATPFEIHPLSACVPGVRFITSLPQTDKWSVIFKWIDALSNSFWNVCVAWPFWNINHSETYFRLALCAVLKKMCTVQTLSSKADNNMYFNSGYLKYPYIHCLKINKCSSSFGLLLVSLHNFGPCILYAASIWRSLHSAHLKHDSEWHIFENGSGNCTHWQS